MLSQEALVLRKPWADAFPGPSRRSEAWFGNRAEEAKLLDTHYIGRDLPTSRKRWRRCWASGMVRDSNPQNSGE